MHAWITYAHDIGQVEVSLQYAVIQRSCSYFKSQYLTRMLLAKLIQQTFLASIGQKELPPTTEDG